MFVLTKTSDEAFDRTIIRWVGEGGMRRTLTEQTVI